MQKYRMLGTLVSIRNNPGEEKMKARKIFENIGFKFKNHKTYYEYRLVRDDDYDIYFYFHKNDIDYPYATNYRENEMSLGMEIAIENAIKQQLKEMRYLNDRYYAKKNRKNMDDY